MKALLRAQALALQYFACLFSFFLFILHLFTEKWGEVNNSNVSIVKKVYFGNIMACNYPIVFQFLYFLNAYTLHLLSSISYELLSCLLWPVKCKILHLGSIPFQLCSPVCEISQSPSDSSHMEIICFVI